MEVNEPWRSELVETSLVGIHSGSSLCSRIGWTDFLKMYARRAKSVRSLPTILLPPAWREAAGQKPGTHCFWLICPASGDGQPPTSARPV